MNVERVRVGDVLKLQRREITIDPLEEYRLIGVYSFGKGILHREPKLGSELGDYRFFGIQPGDLILSNIQAWEGAIAYATDDDLGTIGTHRFLTYTGAGDFIDTNWAKWFFLSGRGMDLIRRAAPGSTMRNRTLAIERFENLEIPLPPLDVQRRVAGRLDRLRDAVDSRLAARTSARNDCLDSLREAALRSMMSDLRNRHVDSLPLGEVGTWSSGGTPSAKEASYFGGSIPWAVIGDLNDGMVTETQRTLTPLGIEVSPARLVPAGTVLVAMYGSIGKLGMAGIEMSTNQAIACCQPVKVSGEYLMCVLRCLRTELQRLGQGGAQQNISQALLRAVKVPLPNDEGQSRFVSRVKQFLSFQDRMSELRTNSRALQASIVPAALNEAFLGL